MARLIMGLGWWVFFNIVIIALFVGIGMLVDLSRKIRGRLAARRLIRGLERSR